MDLAGDPQDPDYHTEMKLHKKAFDYAHENNVNITIHAGEAEGPKSCEQVRTVTTVRSAEHRIKSFLGC